MSEAQQCESLVLQRLLSEGQRPVAESLGVHESTLSRMKSEGDLERFCLLLERLGLKIVDQSVEEWDRRAIEAVSYLARRYLEGNSPITEGT